MRMMLKNLIRRLLSRLNPDRRVSAVHSNYFYKLNVHQDMKDNRDFVKAPLKAVVLPKSIDYSKFASIKDQGMIGSCGSFAACTGLEMMDNIQSFKWPIGLSEKFHYWWVRQPAYFATFPEDSGQDGRSAMKVLNKVGVCPDQLDPYDDQSYNDHPKIFTKSFARLWKIKSYERCLDVNAIKTALFNKQGVWLGVPVQDAFMNNKGEKITYDANARILGGHALAVVGYDDEDKVLKFANSWGFLWGDLGFGYLSYDYVASCPWWDCWAYNL